jgi:quercetin dioxygenase-like cupin family protein
MESLAAPGGAPAASASTVVRIGALELRFLVDEVQSAGSLVTFEFVVPPGARVPAPHYHVAVDEAVYGLSGTLTSMLDGVAHPIGSGDSLFIPRGRVHHHANQGDQVARALIVMSPGLIGRTYFQEVAALAAGPGRPDPARLAEIMARHGLITV